jgi:serine/threonine protein kinase
VLKSVIPFGDFTTREKQARLGAVVLELRALSHQPLRNHRNIVKLLAVGWETDWADPTRKWPVLVQEFAYGALDDVLRSESDSLPYQHRLAMSPGISEGLLALQACGILHGDLKPANVLMYPVAQPGDSDCRWIPKLADFGGSALDIAEGATGRLPMRSVPWQAPEWAEYLSRDGLLRTDLCSLGLTIWSIMANGASLDLNLTDPTAEALKTRSDADTVAERAPAYNDRVLDAYLRLSASVFTAA